MKYYSVVWFNRIAIEKKIVIRKMYIYCIRGDIFLSSFFGLFHVPQFIVHRRYLGECVFDIFLFHMVTMQSRWSGNIRYTGGKNITSLAFNVPLCSLLCYCRECKFTKHLINIFFVFYVITNALNIQKYNKKPERKNEKKKIRILKSVVFWNEKRTF